MFCLGGAANLVLHGAWVFDRPYDQRGWKTDKGLEARTPEVLLKLLRRGMKVSFGNDVVVSTGNIRCRLTNHTIRQKQRCYLRPTEICIDTELL